MGWMLGIRVVVGMFLLRLIVPLVIMLALGHILRHLEARWHLEATREN
jgi:hypothetical protein